MKKMKMGIKRDVVELLRKIKFNDNYLFFNIIFFERMDVYKFNFI